MRDKGVFWLFLGIFSFRIFGCESPVTVNPPNFGHDAGNNTYYSDSSGLDEIYQEKLDIVNENIEPELVSINPQNDSNSINANPVITENGNNPVGVNPALLDLQKELDNGLYAAVNWKDVECWMCETAVDIIKISGCSAISKLSAYAVCGVDIAAGPDPSDLVCIAMATFMFSVLCDIGLDVIEAELGVEILDSGYFCNVLYFHEEKCSTEYTKCIPKGKTQYDFCMAGCLCGNFAVQKGISLPTCSVVKAVFKKAYQKILIPFVCEAVIGESIKEENDCKNICEKYEGILENCGNFACDSDESGDTCCIDCKCTDGYFCTETIVKCAASSCIVPAEVYSCVDENDCIGGNCEEPPDNPGGCPPDCAFPIEPCSENQKCGFNKDGVYCGDCDDEEKCINGKCAITCGIDGCEIDYGEDCCTCPLDCNVGKCVNTKCQKEYCGDGTCQYGESGESPNKPYCYKDCSSLCGDGKCDALSKEDCLSCPKDCFCKGDCCYGICCDAGEVCVNAACCTPKDCHDINKKCGTWPDGCGNSLDCGGCDDKSYCEDGECKKYFDKGYCGDESCVADEDCGNCEEDCGCQDGYECGNGECLKAGCYDGWWQCNNDECILELWVCDGINDCAGGEDEWCGYVCNDVCSFVGETDCLFANAVFVCSMGENGCLVWVYDYVCDGVCDEYGECQLSVCTPTKKVCNNNSVYQEDSCGGSAKVEDCGAGQYCESGECVNKCNLTCSQLGIECGMVGYWCNNSVESINCGECGSGFYCDENGKCKPDSETTSCSFECLGNSIYCVYWEGNVGSGEKIEDCLPGYICEDGACKKCIPKTCLQIDKECGIWADWCGNPMYCGDCPQGYTCSDGICVNNICGDKNCGVGESHCSCPIDCFIKCEDGCCSAGESSINCPADCKECIPTKKVCNNNAVYQEDSCGGSTKVKDCGMGQYCQDGGCSSCVNGCEEGKKKCVSDTEYKKCKLIDGCWQWGSTKECASGYTCEDGECVEGLVDNQCKPCEYASDCGDGYECNYWGKDPKKEHFCHKKCNSNSDCKSPLICKSHCGLYTLTETVCYNNDAWYVDECGAKVDMAENCGDNVCENGECKVIGYQCKPCDPQNWPSDCGKFELYNGYVCMHWPNNPDKEESYCIQQCKESSDCPAPSFCSGSCYKSNKYTCYFGDVWELDSCGAKMQKSKSCGISGCMCTFGNCDCNSSF